MANILVFDAQFLDDSNVAQVVDNDLYAEIYEADGTLRETRIIGSDPKSALFQSADALGPFYTTTVDVSNYSPGDVTIKWYAKLTGVPAVPFPFIETLTYPLGASLTLSDIKDYTRNQLGWPAVAVELSGSNYRTIVEETLSTYNQFMPTMKWGTVSMIAGQSRYPLPQLPSRGPIDVKFVRREGVPLISDPLFGREYPRGNVLDFDQYVLGISMWEMLQRVTGHEPDWEWNEADKELWLNVGAVHLAGPVGHYLVMYRYFDDVTLEQVRANHHRWFRRYALAQAKKILAQVRGKYTGKVPAPGGELTLNYKELMQEGREEEEKLLEEARNMVPSVPPVLG